MNAKPLAVVTDQPAQTMRVLSLQASREVRAGAAAFRELCFATAEISNATWDRFGDGVDGNDYVAIVDAVRASFDANLRDRSAAHSEGYLRALAHMLCSNIYGCGIDVIHEEKWDPIEATRLAYNTRRV